MNNGTTIHPLNHYINQALPPLPNQSSNTPARTRITRACDHCQLRKTKCDSAKPRCSQCVKRNDPCTFTTKVCKRGPKPKRYTSNQHLAGQVQKSTNVYPYPNYFPSSIKLKRNEALRGDFRRSSYPPAHAVDNVLTSSSDYSTDFELAKLPPIQSSPPLVPHRQNASSLRLPSLANSLNLPPIRILLGGCNNSDNEESSVRGAISSPSIYKLNARTNHNQPSSEAIRTYY